MATIYKTFGIENKNRETIKKFRNRQGKYSDYIEG